MKLLSLTINETKILEPSGGVIPNTNQVSLKSLIEGFLSLLTIGGVIIALFFIFYGGWLWINSGGDKTKIEKARMTIIYTFIGLVVIALSFVIVNSITNLLGMTK